MERKQTVFWWFKIKMQNLSICFPLQAKVSSFSVFTAQRASYRSKSCQQTCINKEKKKKEQASLLHIDAGSCCFQTLFLSKTDQIVSKQIIKWMTILWHCICLNQSAGYSSIHSLSDTAWWIIKHSRIWPQGTHGDAMPQIQLFLAIKCMWFASAIAIR